MILGEYFFEKKNQGGGMKALLLRLFASFTIPCDYNPDIFLFEIVIFITTGYTLKRKITPPDTNGNE